MDKCFAEKDIRIKQLEKQVAELKQSRNDYKKKFEKWKRKCEKMKPYADTMARHNNRLDNANVALESALFTIRQKLEEVCPHHKIDPSRETKWGEVVMHYCDHCYKYLSDEEINNRKEWLENEAQNR